MNAPASAELGSPTPGNPTLGGLGMKITKVTPIRATRYLFVRVDTDAGIHGIGEAGAWGHLDASEAAMNMFAPYLVGKDPGPIEHHWNVMQRYGHFRGAATNAAVSAIDVALWDIKGKALGVPVASLLGGPIRTKARVYGHVKAETHDGMVEGALALKERGFTAVGHLNPFLDENRDVAFFKPHAQFMKEGVRLLERLRDALGDEVDICVEIHRRLTPAEAITFGRAIEPIMPLFLEDPIRPDSLDSMARVAERIGVPIATGERFHNLHEFQVLLARAAVEYIRCSICVCGGITAGKKIAAMGEAVNVNIIPHNPLSPVGMAAALQLAAAVPNFTIQEYSTSGLGWNSDVGTELRGTELVTSSPKFEAGFVDIPMVPGIGIDLIEDVHRRHPKLDRDIKMRPHRDGFVVDQ